MTRHCGVLAALMLGLACGDDEGSRASSTAGSVGSSLTAPGPSTTVDDTAGEGTAQDGDDDTTAQTADSSQPTGGGDGPLFDLGSADDGTGSADDGCNKVDFLFIIDNSVSMEDQQAALVGAFPGFITAIQQTLPEGSDYRILVTDTDAWGRCDTVNGFQGIDPNSNTCNNYINTTAFEACDGERGAGVDHPAGAFATNAPCNFAGGNRYILPDEPDIGAAFACAATVGTAGHSSERPMESMLAALTPEINGMGGCNEGFLRDDALLVISFVSDDPNREDTGMPADWYMSVLDAKGGNLTSVVVLGLTPAWDECPGNGDPKGAHWAEFIEMWGDKGIHGSVCGTANDYVTFFQSAVGTIEQACDEYIPG
jgi:hypothetical protein